MLLLLPPLSLLGTFLLLHLRLRLHPELTFFATLCSSDAFLYVAALLGVLHAGSILLVGGGLASLLVAVARISGSAEDRRVARGALCPGLVVVAVGLFLFWLRYRDLRIHTWDEFGHWGLASKYLLLTDHLFPPGSAVLFADYPPAACLFHYFLCFPAPYREGHLYFAQALFAFSPIAVFFSGVSWRQPHWILLRIVATLLLLCLFDPMFFPSLLVDTALGLHFGMAVWSYLALPADLSPRRYLLYAPILFVMPILKEIGFVLGAFVLFIQLFGLCRRRRTFAAWATVLCVFVAAQASWAVRNRLVHAHHSVDISGVSLRSIARALSNHAAPNERAIRAAFLRAVRSKPASWVDEEVRILPTLLHRTSLLRTIRFPQFSVAGWAALVAILSLLACAWERDRARRWRCAWVPLALTLLFGVYLLAHLLIYLFSYAECDSLPMNFFGRYASIYLFAYLLVPLGLLFRTAAGRGIGAAASCAAILAGLYLYETPALVFLHTPPYPPEREALDRRLFDLKKAIPPNERIAMVHQATSGLELRIARYELAPRLVDGPHSLGKPCYPGDVYTEDLSPEEWAALLLQRGDAYVFVSKADPCFWKRYGHLFSAERRPQDFLFRVTVDADGGMLLRPVGSGLFQGDVAAGSRQSLVTAEKGPHEVAELDLHPQRYVPSLDTLRGRNALRGATVARSGAGAGEAKEWPVGEQGMADAPADERPVSFVLDSPWPFTLLAATMTRGSERDASGVWRCVETSPEGGQHRAVRRGRVSFLRPRSVLRDVVVPCGSSSSEAARLRSWQDWGVEPISFVLDSPWTVTRLSTVITRRNHIDANGFHFCVEASPEWGGHQVVRAGRVNCVRLRSTLRDVVVPCACLSNGATRLRLWQDGRCETHVAYSGGAALLAGAAEAQGWAVGYQGIAYGPAAGKPISFALDSPWPITRVATTITLRNYLDAKDIRYCVEASSEEGRHRRVRLGRVNYLVGTATVEMGDVSCGMNGLWLALSVRGSNRFVGIESAEFTLSGDRGEAVWALDDPSLAIENRTDRAFALDAYSGRGD